MLPNIDIKLYRLVDILTLVMNLPVKKLPNTQAIKTKLLACGLFYFLIKQVKSKNNWNVKIARNVKLCRSYCPAKRCRSYDSQCFKRSAFASQKPFQTATIVCRVQVCSNRRGARVSHCVIFETLKHLIRLSVFALLPPEQLAALPRVC